MKLQPRILLILVPLIVAPLLLLSGVAYTQLRTTAEEKTFRQVETVLDQVARQIQSEVRSTEANIQLFANSALLGRYLTTPSATERYALMQPALMRLFHSYQRAYPDYREIRLLLPNGDEDTRVTLAVPALQLDRAADAGLLSAFAQTQDDIQSMFVHEVESGELILLVAKRLRLRDPASDPITTTPTLRGYLLITRSLSALRHPLAQYHSDLGSVLLVTESGRAALGGSSSAAVTLDQNIFNQLKQVDGQRVLGSYEDTAAYFLSYRAQAGLYVVAVLPEHLLHQSTHGLTTAAVSITVAVLVITVLLIVFGLRVLFLAPIATLNEAVREFGQGNFIVPIGLQRRDEIGTLAESFRRMAKSLQRSNEQIRYLAYHDSLTGLPNRHMFREYLADVLTDSTRSKQRLALLYLDVDNFKQVNDTLGHHVGDKLLKEIAKRLTQCLRNETNIDNGGLDSAVDMVARLGGDEFVVLLPYVHETQDADTVAQRILAAMAEPFMLDARDFHVTSSIGIAYSPENGSDADQLIKHADIAMYHAKNSGKNNCQFFTEALRHAASSRYLLENDLRRALEQNEFVLYYQPQVELQSGQIRSVEALIRWNHPQRGFVLPDEFIPLAEETGLILPVGRWVIEQACRQAREWKDAGINGVRLYINISNVQLNREPVWELLAQSMKSYEIAGTRIGVEITETSMLTAPGQGVELIRRLREHDIAVSLDDFGTGYSSLNNLRRFALDSLKIDRGFVFDVHQSADSAAIVSAIIALAKSFNLAVIAEGVENTQQLEYLAAQGCTSVQGNLFGEALCAEDITKIFLRGADGSPSELLGKYRVKH